jgi:cytochrome c-type biogenesis protein CcmF
MITHPVALYLGFTGFTVPFAFALAALITGRIGDEWITITRR